MKNAEILMADGAECVCGVLVKDGVELGRVTDTGSTLNSEGKSALAAAIAGSASAPKARARPKGKTADEPLPADATDYGADEAPLPVAGIDMTKLAD